MGAGCSLDPIDEAREQRADGQRARDRQRLDVRPGTGCQWAAIDQPPPGDPGEILGQRHAERRGWSRWSLRSGGHWRPRQDDLGCR